MKEWILYCVLCSLIYAMSVQAAAPRTMTAHVKTMYGEPTAVLDCAIFIPNLDDSFGKGATEKIKSQLKSKRMNPIVVPTIFVDEMIMQDSNGHEANDYKTGYQWNKFVRNGIGSMFLTIDGFKMLRSQKTKLTWRIYKIGQEKEIAKSIQQGTRGMSTLNIGDLPQCYISN